MANQAYNSASRYQPTGSRYVGIVFVVLLHIGIIYAFVYALGSRAIDILKGPIQVSNIEQPKPKEDEPPPPPPKLEQPPPPFVPPPEISVETTVAAPPTAITTVTNKAPVAPAPVAPPAPPKVGTPPKIGKIPSSESVYPPISKRLGEEGTVTVQMLVGTDGRVADCKIAKSSGYDRLDNAACNAARSVTQVAGTTADGQPMQAWLSFNMRFQLH